MDIHVLIVGIFVSFFHTGQTLTCLQCNGIFQPRHCRSVVDCFDDEVCGVEKMLNAYGEYVYKLGCMSLAECAKNSNSSLSCTQCCNSDICNSEGCGEAGYPVSRGPICYNCPVYRDTSTCHDIDFCKVGEVCMFQETREFGDRVLNAKCANPHICSRTAGASIIGRRAESKQIDARTSEQHVCNACCKRDLCNKNCRVAHNESDNSVETTHRAFVQRTDTTTATLRTSLQSSAMINNVSDSTTASSLQTTYPIIQTTVMNGNRILAIFGSDMVQYIRFNITRVVRGRDWKWENQDSHGQGTIVRPNSNPMWVWVKWDNGIEQSYRIGESGHYDLYIVSI